MVRRIRCFVIPWLLLVSLPVLILRAHAILLVSTPAAKQLVKGPVVHISLRFNSRIDTKRSRITLVATGGGQSALVVDKQVSADTLSTAVKGLKTGSYILRWQVLANDGHITRGEVPFQVE